ncbi:Bifunctional protein GAL10 [Sphaceloma murrayae]|uniref:Bifunctional protein GAL10 n=1 Tax=Sphaceloma murrayae TaxID=2082308 RepID=A0A2K1QHZ9_9PEZI|nr:Bifunctional protein GAL10 [Sphaceloma murrayae]
MTRRIAQAAAGRLVQFVNSTAGRVLACTAVAWLFSFAVCKQLLWRDPHSAFFSSDGVYDLGYSTIRQEEAHRYMDVVVKNGTERETTKAKDPLVCAVYTTFQRDGRQYLQEAIGSMLVGLTQEEREAVDLRLLFAHVESQKHDDWNATWLGTLDAWTGYQGTEDELRLVREWEEGRNFYAKGVYDYLYTLDMCLKDSAAPFIAVFEDDIIFAEGWLYKTLRALSQLGPQQSSSWLYLRLFYTETSLGWDETTDFVYRNMHLTFAAAMALTASILLLARKYSHHARGLLDPATIAACTLVTVPAFTALFFMVGKYNVMPLRGPTLMNKHGCCTQALVFPRYQVESLVHFLRDRGSGQTDALIEEYADRARLQRYALAPQVVQHVGLVSSRDNLVINTRSTWAFWFEAQNAERLRNEHRDMDWGGVVGSLRGRVMIS